MQKLRYVGPDPEGIVGALPLPEGWPALDHVEADAAIAEAKLESELYEVDDSLDDEAEPEPEPDPEPEPEAAQEPATPPKRGKRGTVPPAPATPDGETAARSGDAPAGEE